MQIKRLIKCATCGTTKMWNGIHCGAVMVNGCANYYCFLCWPDHSKIHEEEWRKVHESD
jgi:hypothetical protein